tara:strand:+ start:633 stop:752 length:120 start_codon:yes stop_codon:yes gene_type:complete
MKLVLFFAGAGLGLLAAMLYGGYSLMDEMTKFDGNKFNE